MLVYRAGTAARMAGLPVETLRVWERRYHLSETRRSSRGQRLYSAEQVERLALLKRLVDQGHGIGLLASLSQQQLQMMLEQHHPAQSLASTAPIRILVAGPSLARRLAAQGAEGLGLVVRGSGATLADLLSGELDRDAEVLLVEKSELNDTDPASIAHARARLPVALLVLYRFAPSATIRALRSAGCLVARLPADLSELGPLCRLALRDQRMPLEHKPRPLPAPRYAEEMLTTLVRASGRLACECPRHLAEVLMTVASFERYSAQCASRSPREAALHVALQRSAGQARVLLEDALEQLALAEGIPLTPAAR